MNQVKVAAELQRVTAEIAKSRAAMSAAKVGSRKWLAAEGELNFWQGKQAYLAAA